MLADPGRHLLIVELDGKPVGQVRFDRRRGFAYEVSVGLDPAARGQGIGTRAIAGACEWLWQRTHASTVVAAVGEDNAASLAAFDAAGFRGRGHDEGGFAELELPAPEPFAVRSPADRRRELAFSD